MRSPEHRIAQPRAGRQFQDELQLRYLSPGAFTVLPPDDNMPPNPPSAPEPYRLTPSTRRHKNQSFAVIGEVDPSRSSSRSPSPTGRVSPFRGRGFNPSGSRFASPNPSPLPPEDARLTPTKLSPRHTSRIPQLKKKVSTSAFGERVYHRDPSTTGRKLNTKLSQSLTNLEPKKSGTRPPQSPRKNVNRTPAFQKLSPIAGSSPEPSQSLSSPSPSRIPKSRSTPPSRRSSPTRNLANKPPPGRNTSRAVSRAHSRSQSRSESRGESRDTSPTKIPASPTKIPATKYRNVPAKVNSFSKPKPKVPPKPQALNDQSEESDVIKNVTKPTLNRKDSVNKIRTNSKVLKTEHNSNNINNNRTAITTTTDGTTSDSSSSVITKINNNNSVKNNTNGNVVHQSHENGTTSENLEDVKGSPQKSGTKNGTSSINEKISHNGKTNNSVVADSSSTVRDESQKIVKDTDTATDTDTSYDVKETTDSGTDYHQPRKSESLVKLSDMLPSTTAVVSSTTTTVTQPLKIDASLNMSNQLEKVKAVSPMVDGRILSATSVSNAMNRMNDSVLNTQTLIKDHGLSRLSPAANAIISVANESNRVNPALDTKNATTALPQIAPISSKPESNVAAADTNNIGNDKGERANNHTNHITHTGIISAKALEMEVQKNMSRLISPEHTTNSVQKSVNDRIKEARTVVAADVKPIRITVREKPSDVEVQSGNVRLPVSISNGLNERPGLPPAAQTPPNEPAKEEPPKNVCTKFLSTCKSKMSCQGCKKTEVPHTEQSADDEHPKERTGCFSCLSKKKDEPVRINIEDETGGKPKLWDKLKCCNKHRVRDAGCFPLGKRKDSWVERRDSTLGEQLQQPTTSRPKCSKACCKDFLMKAFCVNLCCKKKIKEDPISRKASVMSKKKSLTPTTAPPPEDTRPKIDLSLVEHASHMKGAIPVLPICLAWFCLVMNCIAPGTGTVLSGLFCLCIGKPRFSQNDGPRQRIGSFIINTIVGFGQFFTVLFCLVGWGWSIWWGVIMLKVAKKHKKLKHLEAIEEASRPAPASDQNHHSRDPERNA